MKEQSRDIKFGSSFCPGILQSSETGKRKKKKPSTIAKKSFKNRLLALLETTKKSSKTKV
jgi:hypothetical protein